MRTSDRDAHRLQYYSALTNPAELGVLDAAALLRDRSLSAVQLTDACLERVEQLGGGPPTFAGAPEAINAWARVYPELAREQARAADERLALERDAAPIVCGIPLALKDLYAVAGLPLTASSRVLEDHVAREDSAVWATLRDQGMVLLGHTHTHEFAAGGTTDQVGNPWSLDRVVGGSSGGNAAALTARMVPAAVGTDTCGSLRIPSACCGTSAIKPTHGRIPLDGIIPLAPSLDHPGPMARTVADSAAVLAAMAPDGELPLTARPGPTPLGGVTIALTDRTDSIDLEAPVAAALDQAIAACERLGAKVVRHPAPWTFDWNDLSVVLLTEAWSYHAQHAERRDLYRPAIKEFVDAASNFTSAEALAAAQRRRAQGTAEWERWFAEHAIDLVLEPTLPIVPYERGPGYDSGHAGGPGDPMIALTALWDMTGMPVACMPVTWEAGVSLIAPRGRERRLLQPAIDLQEHALGVQVWVP
jgi:aspartyl-tRNA(Asn)/glutamyl-tRNA(Gln) amidotransferase subunit A